jgi:prepilin signal peptidase PulO-like enzyme (type II secretory pathway)
MSKWEKYFFRFYFIFAFTLVVIAFPYSFYLSFKFIVEDSEIPIILRIMVIGLGYFMILTFGFMAVSLIDWKEIFGKDDKDK